MNLRHNPLLLTTISAGATKLPQRWRSLNRVTSTKVNEPHNCKITGEKRENEYKIQHIMKRKNYTFALQIGRSLIFALNNRIFI